MPARTLVAFASLLLLFAPVAEAGSKPVAYFLKDGDPVLPDVPDPPTPPVPLPIVVPVPEFAFTGDGLLQPYEPALANIPNSTEPKSRPITQATDLAYPLQFLTDANHTHGDRLRGTLVMALYVGPSALLHGNLTATLYTITGDADPVPVGTGSVALDFNASEIPNATALIPPDPTNPQAVLYYELLMLSPALQNPPLLAYIGPLDLNLTNDTRLALGVHLDQGSSPAPLPAGAMASLQFDSIYTPSLVVVPWYTADPPKPTPPPKSSTSTSSGAGLGSSRSSSSGADGSDDGGGSKGAPGLGVPALVALAAVAAALARRRLR